MSAVENKSPIKSPVIELHNATVTYQSKPAIWNVDYQIPEGKMVGVIGPNGSGKTTMLKATMGLIPLSSGFAKLFGKDLEEVRHKIAYVPQRSSVDWDFPANVFDTVLMGRYRKHNLFSRTTKHDKEIAWDALKKVHLESFAKRQIAQLSGGQQQRVFIARALAQQAELYLLDEPFAGVDATTENTIINLLKEMNQEGKSIVVVHHDLNTVSKYFNWLVMMNTRLIASGPTEEIFTTQILQNTYGGRLNILSQVAELIGAKAHPMREKQKKNTK